MIAFQIPSLGAVSVLTMGLLVVSAEGQEKIQVDDRVEVLALYPGEAVVPGQSFALGVRIAVESEFLEKNLVQLFRQRVDLPLQIQAPWLESYPGLQLEPFQESGQEFSIILNQDVTQARPGPTQEHKGRAYRCFDLYRMARATAPGELTLSGPSVRLAYATEFRDELLVGRAAVNRMDHTVKGASFQVLVQDFPAQGRPLAFVDAVGQFTLKSSISSTHLQLGQALSLTIRIEGRGNIATMSPPALDHLPGWRLQGVGLAREQNALVQVATLSPLNPRLGVLPAVDFAWFDPRFKQDPVKRFQEAHTPNYPVEIEAQENLERIETRVNSDESPSSAREKTAPKTPRLFPALALLALGSVFLAFLLFLKNRARRSQSAAAKARIHSARKTFENEQRNGIDDTQQAFVAFLSGALGWPKAALLDHNLGTRLHATGLPRNQVQQIIHCLAEFDAAQFGGGPRPETDVSVVVRATADELLRTLESSQ